MSSCTIQKMKTSTNGNLWLTVLVGSEFVYPMIVRSSKTEEDYTVGQVITVPTQALQPIPTA